MILRPVHVSTEDPVTWYCVGAESPLFESGNEAPNPTTTGLSVAVCTRNRAGNLKRFLESLSTQRRTPDELLIVDSSPDAGTELMIREFANLENLARSVRYARVRGNLIGLTRQRNFAASQATRDLIAYFDDDVVLKENCLAEMEKVHRAGREAVAGVGAVSENEIQRPSARWKLRRALGVIPALEPGRYYRSGISTPWGFREMTDDLLEGDWLAGCAMMWKTEIVRRLRFNADFQGYANGEDLEFSLRARSMGRLIVAGKARLLHLQAPGGRPDPYMLGYTTLSNAYRIHLTSFPRRTWRDAGFFYYGVALDLVIRFANLLRPGRTVETWRNMMGMLRFFRDLQRRDASAGIRTTPQSFQS